MIPFISRLKAILFISFPVLLFLTSSKLVQFQTDEPNSQIVISIKADHNIIMSRIGYEEEIEQDVLNNDLTVAGDANFDENMVPVELANGDNDDDNKYIEEQVWIISGTVFIDDENE